MAEERRGQTPRKRRRQGPRWTLGATAPEWLRRIWGERTREVPKISAEEMARLRRIAYL